MLGLGELPRSRSARLFSTEDSTPVLPLPSITIRYSLITVSPERVAPCRIDNAVLLITSHYVYISCVIVQGTFLY